MVGHTEEDKHDTLQPIAHLLMDAGDFESAAKVLREWCGVSSSPAAREAFCDLLEASTGLASLEFASSSKGHWKEKLDCFTFERIVVFAAEDHRRAATRVINLAKHQIGGAFGVSVASQSRRKPSLPIHMNETDTHSPLFSRRRSTA